MADLVTDGTNSLLKLDQFLPNRLAVLSNAVANGLASIHERHGLGASEWLLLLTLGEGGAMTATALCAKSRMHKTGVSRAVAALLRRELILRKANPADMRQAFLQLSPSGKDIYRASVKLAQDYASKLVSAMSAEERAAFERSLGRLAEQSRRLMADPFVIGSMAKGQR